ncbi:NAD-dependent protein deacylase sirtuin-5, mitochondrial-like [Helicoverpa zea]|uniref:NAD-dependent protein deacylase sirtuin-5, mitochondrial-like n=1 Tax=Helicoverpa zea TaxID=7113 RepID=UPI001F568852|nr:NAD-dependent protein deacylase sirtuin-5, mitochondrial-like [Helicoverpa zea]
MIIFISRPVYKHSKTSAFLKFCSKKQSSDFAKLKHLLKAAKQVVVLTGAGISAESGVPTFRGPGGLWRKLDATLLANPSAFREDPGLVWEFYHYRRELVLKAKPNAGHIAIASYEARHVSDKKVTVITQNVDGLHARAGTKNIIELHGNLFKTRCTKCNEVLVNTDSPICAALAGTGSPNSDKLISDIKEKDLPHCTKPDCGGLLRPHIVWFGEFLDPKTLEKTDIAISQCNVCLVVGTSSIVYPAAAFPTVMSASGSIVAEFNIEPSPGTPKFDFYFQGPSATTLPQALSD